MTENISLEELYRNSVKFPGPSVPLTGLHTALEAVEQELEHARDQARIRLHARHKRDAESLHPEEKDLDLYQLEVTVEQILPRVFRGGFALTLWSVFEVVSKQMAEYVCRERGRPSVQPAFRYGNFLKNLKIVYEQDLGIVAFPDPAVRDQLNQLCQVRNTLIHHNGSLISLQASLRLSETDSYAALGLQTYADLHEEFVIPNADFLSRNLAVVHEYLTALSERAYSAVHSTPL